jgi:hypothetical protein
MKFLHDEKARLIAARYQGIVAGNIQLLQQVLSLDETPMDDLLQEDFAVLTQTFSELQKEFRPRGEGYILNEMGDGECGDVGVLNVISQSPQDRQFYEARMKFLHDEEARLIFARAEGRAEGFKIGLEESMLVWKIQLLQQVMSLDETPMDDLFQKDLAVLTHTFSELQKEFRSRGEA